MDFLDHFKKNFGDYAFIGVILFIFRQIINPEVYTMNGLYIFACFSVLLCAFTGYLTYKGIWPIWKFEPEDFEE